MSHGKHSKKKEIDYRLPAAILVGGSVVPLTFTGSANAATGAEWDRVAQCESGGRWNLSWGHADSTGGLQIQDRTWRDFGGTAIAPQAWQATKEQQIQIAEKILAVQGPRAWSVTWNGTCPGATLSRTPYTGSTPTLPPAPKPAPAVPSEPADAEDGTYVVKEGDTLSSIAVALDIEGGWKNLYAINKKVIGDDPNVLEPGLKLTLPGHEAPPVVTPPAPKAKVVYTVKQGDWLMKIAKNEYGDEHRWKAIYAVNKKVIGDDPNLIFPGQQFKLPGAHAAVATKPAPKVKPPKVHIPAQRPAPKPPVKSSGYVLPVHGRIGDSLIIGSGGSMSRSAGGHSGLDISAPHGTPVVSAAAGVVVSVNGNAGAAYGNYIVVRHTTGIYTLYAHLSATRVSVGQAVGAGQVIGNVGSTGNASGPHLHFEVRTDPSAFRAGIFLNPLTWLRSHGVSV